MCIEFFKRFHKGEDGMASLEFVFTASTIAAIFYLGLNFTYLVREFDELRDTGRLAVWLYQENGEEFGTGACVAANLRFTDSPSRQSVGTRFVNCISRNSLPEEERVARVPFWVDLRSVVGGGAFENGLVRHVEPDPLRLLVSNARQFQSGSAAALGASFGGFTNRSDLHAVSDWIRWTHEDQPFDEGYDQFIFNELRKEGTHRLFPNVFTKAR